MPAANQSLSQGFDPKLLAALEGLDFKARYVMEGFLSGLHDSAKHQTQADDITVLSIRSNNSVLSQRFTASGFRRQRC